MELYDFQKISVNFLIDKRSSLLGDNELLEGLNPKLFFSKYKLDNETGCWLWQGALGGSGFYGTYAWRYINKLGIRCKKQMPAHRITYTIFKGIIPNGLILDHLCRNHACGNPDCLEAVTHKENQNRGLNCALKTECRNGHQYTEDNIYIDPTRGWRECRACRYDAVIKHRSKEVV